MRWQQRERMARGAAEPGFLFDTPVGTNQNTQPHADVAWFHCAMRMVSV
jgi:hypothetical protein